jgi:hypothetical protein
MLNIQKKYKGDKMDRAEIIRKRNELGRAIDELNKKRYDQFATKKENNKIEKTYEQLKRKYNFYNGVLNMKTKMEDNK